MTAQPKPINVHDYLLFDERNCILPLAAIYDGISLPHQQESD